MKQTLQSLIEVVIEALMWLFEFEYEEVLEQSNINQKTNQMKE